MYKLKTTLSITYGIIALVTVGIIALLSNQLVDTQFASYVAENTEKQIINIVQDIGN